MARRSSEDYRLTSKLQPSLVLYCSFDEEFRARVQDSTFMYVYVRVDVVYFVFGYSLFTSFFFLSWAGTSFFRISSYISSKRVLLISIRV